MSVVMQRGIVCLDCRTRLFSNSGHDFVECPCPNGAYVDGGFSYLRVGAMDLSRVREISREVDRARLPRNFRDEEPD